VINVTLIILNFNKMGKIFVFLNKMKLMIVLTITIILFVFNV